MALKANYEFLFVGKDENSFLENYVYDLFEEHGDNSGQIFINLEVQNNPVDAEELGQVMFETMQKVFFENLDRDPYDRFELSLKAVNGVLAEYKDKKVSGYIGNLNVVVVAIVGDALYLSKTGDSEAYLIRKRYVSVITEGLGEEEDESGDVFTSIANGTVEAGDMVLFSSTRLLRYISKTDLAKAVTRKSVVETLDEIKDVISTEMLGRVGLTGMLFGKPTKAELEEALGQEDHASENVMESSATHTAAVKKKLLGSFLNKIKRSKSASTVYGGGFVDKLKNWAGDFLEGVKKGGFGKSQILILLVSVILFLLLAVYFVNSGQVAREEIAKLDEVLDGISERLAEADTKSSYDKEGAKEILDKAYLDAMTVLNSGHHRDRANRLLVDINNSRDNLDNVLRLSTPKVLADLSEKRSDVSALGFVTLGDRVFVYESNGLYEVVLDQVADPLTIDDEETVIAATGFDDRDSLVFMTKSGKLIEYKEGTIAFMDSDDGAFRKGVDIADWSNRVYLLDAAGSQIWRYAYRGTRDAFATGEAYFGEDLDLSNAVSLAIDASVYVLLNNGDIMKFYGRQKADLIINNPPYTNLNDPKVIYTDEKTDFLYVLDGAEARVLVYLKDASTGNLTYQKQYLFDGVGDLRDMYVDSGDGKLYVLNKSKIIEVTL